MKSLIFLLACLSAQILSAADKPNILFIFSDDWGWEDLSCHGHPYVKTPNIDRLAKEGTDFYRFTVASGVCSPSRAAVVTGQFPARYSIDGHFAWVPSNAKRGMPDWLPTNAPLLQRFLQKAGYRTAHFGKWHLANNMIPDSPLPSEYGYDEYGAFNCAGEQMPYHEDSMHCIKFIEKSVAEKKPFFVNLWIHEPHTPFHTQPKYEWRFRDLPEKDRIYASVLSHADDRIGEVLDALDRLKIADNTLVIFSSDNGPARAKSDSQHRLMYDTATGAGWDVGAAMGITGGRKGWKACVYEGGIGVPFIVRWPGKVTAGKINKVSPISAVDLLPTFCELAGAELPKDYKSDGLSQVQALLGKDKETTRTKPLFWKMPNKVPASKVGGFHWVTYAVMHEDFKLLANHDLQYFELYDIVNDPMEKNDLKESKTEVAQKLLKQIKNWQAELPTEPTGDVFSSLRETK